MSEQMPSHNISYYLDVQRLIPLIYLRFQKIPSLVFPTFFVVWILFVTVFLSSDFQQISSVYFLIDSLGVRHMYVRCACSLIIFKALKVDGLHFPASILKKINYYRLEHQKHSGRLLCAVSIPAHSQSVYRGSSSAHKYHSTFDFQKAP